PTREQIRQMNPNYQEFRFPQIKAHPWHKVFRNRTPPMAIDLVCRLLDYTPATRLTPLEACAHAFFDELRDPDTRLPNGPLPPLFNFSQQEININPTLNSRLIPAHLHGQQTVTTSGNVISSTNSTPINASATGVNTTGTSNVNEKSITPTNHTTNTPPPSVLPTTNMNGPDEDNLDEQTTSGDSLNKDRS
ncbi:unnamed protein product, partial [Rotaria sp. Silwood1]